MRNFIRNGILIIISALCGCAAAYAADRPTSRGDGGASQAQCQEAKTGGPEDLVRKLYGREEGVAPEQRKDQLRVVVLSRFFDKKLTAWLMRQNMLDCYDDAPDACDVSDFLVAGDNANMKNFRVCAMSASDNTVSVRFEYKNKPTEFTYKLAQTNNGWRITAISHIGITYDGS